MSPYKHGVQVSEVATAVVPPRSVAAGMPFVVGAAPVHMVKQGENGPVNVPKLLSSYSEAVNMFGFSDDFANYTLCEFFKVYFQLYNVAPIVVVNVFDPATHKATITSEAQTLDSNDEVQLAQPGLVANPVVKDDTDTTTYVLNTDYTVDWITGIITRLVTGAIGAGDTLHITYDYGDPSLVASADIIGGVVAEVYTGLECINQVFPMYSKVVGSIVAPGWSHNSAVAAVMIAKAGGINGHFKAMAILDIPESVTVYSDVNAYKNTNNLTDKLCIVCWPKVTLGSDEYWLSSHVAGLISKVDEARDGVPYKSPSNERLQIDGTVIGGNEVWLGFEQANTLNGQGVVTALNMEGGWKLWGNRTGAYPSVTDVKDSFIPIRRMFNWIGNTLILTYWQKIDFPITNRLINTVVDSNNIWLNGLTAREYILGGKVDFREDENPVTDVIDGIIKFHVMITPPSPARSIEFILEYDVSALSNLFS